MLFGKTEKMYFTELFKLHSLFYCCKIENRQYFCQKRNNGVVENMPGELYLQEEMNDNLREECGVFGMYDFAGGNVATSIYYGLLSLQHRGQ